jgi:hypothetical protein
MSTLCCAIRICTCGVNWWVSKPIVLFPNALRDVLGCELMCGKVLCMEKYLLAWITFINFAAELHNMVWNCRWFVSLAHHPLFQCAMQWIWKCSGFWSQVVFAANENSQVTGGIRQCACIYPMCWMINVRINAEGASVSNWMWLK